jgi:hypothetical protein
MTSPWLTIWTQPRATMMKVAGRTPTATLWLLAFIYGFSSLMNLFQSMAMGHAASVLSIVAMTILLAAIWGYITFTIWSWFVTFTGRWLGGKGDFQTIRLAYAWSSVPLLINIPLWLLMTAFFGRQMFLDFPESQAFSSTEVVLLMTIFFGKVVSAVWSFVIYFNALAVVQKFSVLKAIFNTLLAGLILMVLFFVFWNALMYIL